MVYVSRGLQQMEAGWPTLRSHDSSQQPQDSAERLHQELSGMVCLKFTCVDDVTFRLIRTNVQFTHFWEVPLTSLSISLPALDE